MFRKKTSPIFHIFYERLADFILLRNRTNRAKGILKACPRAYIASMNFTWETALIFVAAAALVAIVAWVMRLKTRGVLRVLINSIAGGALIAGLSAFNVLVLPFNPLNTLIIGTLGLPGAGIVVAAALLL